jgi:tetratricopeptide (TPR) repeat protein
VAVSLECPSALLVNLGRLSYSRAVLKPSDSSAPAYQHAQYLARQAIYLNPQNSRAYLLAGLVERTQGRDAAAIAPLRRAAQLDAADVLTNTELAATYYRLGQEQLALQHWRAARATASFLTRAVDAYSLRSDWAEALECFKIATRVDPEEYEAWLGLGHAYTVLKDLDDARKSYEEAIRRHPTRAEGYLRLAELYNRHLTEPALARAVVADGLAKARPLSGDLYYLGSHLAAARHDYAMAEQDARRAINLDPSNGAYLLWLGDLFVLEKLDTQAVAQFTQTMANSREPRMVWVSQLSIGHLYAAQGQWTAAVEAYQSALSMSLAQRMAPTAVAENCVVLGDALLKIARIDLARSAFQEALKYDPANQTAARRLVALKSP